ncbi:helix-turn-helix domain-containing protein [Streptomyces sp. NPDC055025]
MRRLLASDWKQETTELGLSDQQPSPHACSRLLGRPESEDCMVQQPNQFGRELRRLRLASGITLAVLAGIVHYSKGQLSKVERGIQPPSEELARLSDAALGADGALIALAPAGPMAGKPVRTATDDEEVWVMHVSTEGQSWFRPVSRRQMMAAGAASAVSGLGINGPAPSAELAAGGLLEASRSLFGEFRRLGQMGSPALVLPALITQTHLLRDTSASADPSTRRALLRLASRYAEYAGWLMQESGNEEAALSWTRHAVELADAGGDHDLAAYALVRRALVTLYRRDAGQTIELARQAQFSALPPRIRGLAAQREAQGHALAGDYDACMRCLERARGQFDRDEREAETPVIGPTHLSDPVGMITGWCLHDLGRPREAAAMLDRQVAEIPAEALRTQARYGARRALAHAAAGDIDLACVLTGELLDSVTAANSATIATDTRHLARTLARHPRNPSVRALAPSLTSLPHPAAQ